LATIVRTAIAARTQRASQPDAGIFASEGLSWRYRTVAEINSLNQEICAAVGRSRRTLACWFDCAHLPLAARKLRPIGGIACLFGHAHNCRLTLRCIRGAFCHVIRFRAERRLGEMLVRLKETVGLNPGTRGKGNPNWLGGPKSEPPKQIPPTEPAPPRRRPHPPNTRRRARNVRYPTVPRCMGVTRPRTLTASLVCTSIRYDVLGATGRQERERE
jgi:hypothetical protein